MKVEGRLRYGLKKPEIQVPSGKKFQDDFVYAYRKTMSRRTETAYKTESPGKSAQHDNALDSGDTVNAAVA